MPLRGLSSQAAVQMADDSGQFDSSNPWMKNKRTTEPSFKKKKHARYFDPVAAETDPSHSTRRQPSRRFKVNTGIAYDPKSEFPREEKPILEAKMKKEKLFVANLKRANTWKGGLTRFQKKNLQDDRKYPGKAPVPQDRLDRHSRGEGMNPQGVQTKFYAAKLKKREADIEQSIEQAARTELLLAEDGGFLEADVGECTRQFTQQQIAAAVDITSATKHFDLQLGDFGPYRMDYNRTGRYLLLGGRKGHVAAIDWLTKRLLCEMNVMEEVFDISWLHIETMFAVAQKNWVYVYDNQGIELHCLKQLNHVLRMEFLPYHFLLATANEGGYLSWLDISIGKIISQLNTRQGRLNVVTQNPANATICLGHTKGTVTMWSPTVRTPLAQVLCHQHPVQAITVDPSGRYMATAGVDRTLKLWDMRMVRGNLQEYRMRAAATNLAFSQRRLLAVAMGNTVEVYRDCVSDATDAAYLKHRMAKSVGNLQFCPFEDVLGVAHAGGFTSLIVPGAGEPNLDGLESNPYQTKSQRKEAEVKSLLEKIQPEFITLDSSAIAEVDLPTVKEKMEAQMKLLHFKPPKVELEHRKKSKGKKGSAQMAKTKKILHEDSVRDYVKTIKRVGKKNEELNEEKERARAPTTKSDNVLDRFKAKKSKSLGK